MFLFLKYTLVRQAADVFGFSINPDGDFTSNLLWNDTFISMDIVSALKPYQKVNHFPTMSEISRKDLLARNFDKYNTFQSNIFFILIFFICYRLSRNLPDEYNFTPKTWILPNEYNAWYLYASNKSKRDPCAYILKPNNGAMGHG
jgi:tubulin polyglutamylase TTLL7